MKLQQRQLFWSLSSGIFVFKEGFFFFLKEGAMEFDRRSNLRGQQPARSRGPTVGKAGLGCGRLCPPGSAWHLLGAQ